MHISLRKLVPVYLGTSPPSHSHLLHLGPPGDGGLTFYPPKYDEATSSKGGADEAIEEHGLAFDHAPPQYDEAVSSNEDADKTIEKHLKRKT